MLRNSTLPTGKDVLDNLIPSKEPAQATWYSRASSQKYFNELSALGHSCISSKIISVVLGFIFYPYVTKAFVKFFPSLGVWNTPLAFITTLIIARILLSLLFNTILRRTPVKVHTHGANRFMGMIPGAINGLIYATILAAVLLTMPLRNDLAAKTPLLR